MSEEYKIGDQDTRPWGSYRVTAVGSDFCEKEIIVKPGQTLSLQSHDHRKETWTVTSGTLTALLNDQIHELKAGQSIHIPLGALHCMANRGINDVVVHERQEGICREADIHRYFDAYGRSVTEVTTETQKKSLRTYQQLLRDNQKAMNTTPTPNTALKMSIIVMTTLLIIGLGLFGYGIATKTVKKAGVINAEIVLQPGEDIIDMTSLDDGILALHIRTGNQTRIETIDAKTGRKLGVINIVPAPAAAATKVQEYP
jgi:mannose-6-phosphate isomerase-like protein (cupin superfamily)